MDWSEIEDDAEEIQLFTPTLLDIDAGHCCRCTDLSCTPDNYHLICKTSCYIISTVTHTLETQCLINEFYNSTLNMYNVSLGSDLFVNELMNYCDLFLRQRHEILHSLFMLSVNKEDKKSDMKFCDMFPISSIRTPDYIEVSDKEVIIIETSVTSDVGKSYMMKGKEDKGYQSKYEIEIQELKSLGYRISYIVVVYNMRDFYDMSYKSDLNSASKLFGLGQNPDMITKLEFVRRGFCRIQDVFGKKLSKYFSLLFKKSFTPEIKCNEVLDILCKDRSGERSSYSVATISQSHYGKLLNSLPRIRSMFDDLDDKDSNYELHLDVARGRYRFNAPKFSQGMSHNNWGFCLSNFDRSNIIMNTFTVVDGSLVNDTSKSVEMIVPSHIEMPKIQVELSHEVHPTTLFHDYEYSFLTYSIAESVSKLRNLRYEDCLYENKMETMILDYLRRRQLEEKVDNSSFKNKKPFASNLISEKTFQLAKEGFESSYKIKNDFSCDFKHVLHQKPSYTYPLIFCSGSKSISIKEKPFELLNALLKIDIGEYTKIIIRRALDNNFSFGSRHEPAPKVIHDLEVSISTKQREMHKFQFANRGVGGELLKLRDIEGGIELVNEYKALSRSLKYKSKEFNYRRTNVSIIRLPTKRRRGNDGSVVNKLSNLGQMFQSEMSHFKKKTEVSVYKGVGRFDQSVLNSEYQDLKRSMLSPSGVMFPDKVYDEFVADDRTLLLQLKTDAVNANKFMYDFLKGTNIYSSAAMVSRFCYTLLYFSQTSINSDYILCDNLGFEDTLLICKGGKKIFKTKKSKLFRIVFKTYPSAVKGYVRPGYISSFVHFLKDGQDFIVSPWMSLDEVLLTDGMTFLSRTMGYTMMNVTKRVEPLHSLSDCYFNIMLAWHARRKTEVFMHNMRYIVVNSMSEVSCLDKMLPELADFNYDFFQTFLRENLLNNFVKFGIKLKCFHDEFKGGQPDNLISTLNVTHLFDDVTTIDSMESLTLTIYCTFLMSKAPVTQALEQTSNLFAMLKTHELHNDSRSDDISEQYAKSTVTLDQFNRLEDYWSELFKSDFNYDPKYVTLLGNMCSDYLLSKKTVSEISSKWESIVDEPWDKMANTSGLRGDRNKTDFFGKKGYYVVYKDVMNDEEFMTKSFELMTSDADDYTKRKLLNGLNQTFAKKINKTNLDEAIFHVVDKIQRSGKREIYVMDYKTKLYQQPIEKFFAYICKMVPNELISTPSNKRLFQIHSTVFEKFLERDGICYNMSLDCRRWAPHSVINKFLDFILGMRNCLPEGLIIHCLNFFEKMFSKKVYTRKYVYDIMSKNKSMTEKQKGYFIEDEVVSGHYLTMSYSWVMGIFNYLSSLLHVMNQMHATQMIMRCNSLAYNADFEMHLNAHSDDSGGKLITPSRSIMIKSFTIYELLLKSCNHMLSDKKCNISKTYLELLSILYIGNRLLSLLNKFSGAFNFHPSDKGYCSDIMEAYSKSTELIINGASFSQAYIALKIMSFLIWRFYFGNEVNRMAYNLPPQLLGMPDAHPLNVLICGGDSDIIRLNENNIAGKTDCLDIASMVYISKYFNTQSELMDTFIAPINCEPQIIMSGDLRNKQKINDGLDEDLKWFVRNVQQRHTPLLLMSYIERLKTKGFCASLQDETLVRRISRAYYFRGSRSCKTDKGYFNYDEIRAMIEIFIGLMKGHIIEGPWSEEIQDVKDSFDAFVKSGEDVSDQFSLLHSEVILMNRSFDCLGYSNEDVVISAKTCKPIHLNIQRVNTPLTQDYKPDHLTSWLSFPKLRWLLPPSGYDNQINMLQDFLSFKNKNIPINNPNWLFRLLSKYKGKYLKEMYFHSNMPAGSRDVNNYRDILYFLAHNSFDNKYIEGIVSPYNKTMSLPIEQLFEDFLNSDLSNFINLLDLFSGLTNRTDMLNEVLKLKINGFEGNLKEFLIRSGLELSDKYNIFDMLTPHLNVITECEENGRVKNPQVLKNSYFHCFIKRQHLVGNVWLGKGRLFFSLPSVELLLEVDNQRVSAIVLSNNTASLNKHEITYIDYILQSSQLNNLKSSMESVKPKDWNIRKFGITEQGNFSVDFGRDLVSCINNTAFNKKPHNVLSNIDICKVKIMPRLKYTVESQDADGKRTNTIIHSFDIPNTKLLDTCYKMFNNEQNLEFANRSGSELKDLLTDIIGESTLSERKIKLRTMVDSYTVSKLYMIMKSLIDSQDYNPMKNSIRQQVYPGQEGGMLDLLIKYKDLRGEFLFKYDRVLTPELMHLKSSQPELFISNLITKIDEKYKSLYDSKDRDTIMSQLLKIMSRVDDENNESDLAIMLSTWSYIGVMGALGETKTNKAPETFKFFRYDPKKGYFNDFCKRFLNDVFKSILYCFEAINIADYVVDKTFKLPKSRKQMSLFIVSWCHSQMLSTYGHPTSYNSYKLCSHNIAFYELIQQLFMIDEFRLKFYENVDELPIITNMPISEFYCSEWLMCLITSFNNVIVSLKDKSELQNNTLIQRNITPVVKTQDFLSGTISFNVKNLYHNGTISRDFYRDRRGRHTVIINKQHHTFDFIPSDLAKRGLSLNTEYVIKRPIAIQIDDEDDDFEDELMEVTTELGSREPDVDYIDECFKEDWMVDAYNRKIFLSDKGKMIKSILHKVNVINLVGMSGHQQVITKILDIGETILVISDYIITEFVPSGNCDKLAIFKSKSRPWTDRSIIDPQFLFFHVKDGVKLEIEPWTAYLEAEHLSFNKVRQMLFQTPFGEFYNHAGVKVENNMLETNFESMYEMMKESYEEMHKPIIEEEEVIAEPEVSIYDEMLEKGFSRSLVDRYRISIEKMNSEDSGATQILKDIISKIMSESKKTKELEISITKILSKRNDKVFLNRVFELPSIFSAGLQANSDLKNQALKDTMLRAELESLCSGLTNKVLSGMLNISPKKHKFMMNQIKLYRAYAKMNAGKEKNKLFIIDVAILILNDARIIADSDCDSLWDRVVESLSDYITDDDSDSDNSDMSVYGTEGGTGKLNYDLI